MLQFFFMGRMPWLERVFGLDALSRIHRANGKRAFWFLVAHPILIIAGYSLNTGLSFWGQYLELFTQFPHIRLATLGSVLFLIVYGTSVYTVVLRLKYESWYFVHLTAYLAVFASFWHQFSLGTDLLDNRIFYGYWVALYIAVFASHLVFRFLRPWYLYQRHQFRVARLERESPEAVSVYISGKNLDRFPVQPGQFMIFRFLTRGLWWQAHPFSLSMVPNGRELRITVKELGDFTKIVRNLAIGAKVLIDGPYGVFTDLFSVSSRVLLIAGGIGITPIRSLAEQMLAKGKDVAVLYANKTTDGIVFKKELEALKERYPARIIHVISEQPDYAGERGRIDQEKIVRLVPDVASREVYLCGPPPMMDSLIGILRGLGLAPERIHYEKFELG